jgi:hypothetical protein
VPAVDREAFRVVAEPGRVGLTRKAMPAGAAQLVRPLSTSKPWGAKMSASEQAHLAKGRAMATLTAICLVLLVAGMVLERTVPIAALHGIAFLGSAIAGGFFTLRSTLRSLAKFRFDVNLLMLLAALGAGAIGYVFEAAVLMFLFSLSNTLEVYTMGRTRRALHALLKLRPARALVRRNGREIEGRGRSGAGGRARDREAGRGDSRRRHGARGRIARRPEQPDGRVGAGAEGRRRQGVRRHAQPAGRDRGAHRRAPRATRRSRASSCWCRRRRSRSRAPRRSPTGSAATTPSR